MSASVCPQLSVDKVTDFDENKKLLINFFVAVENPQLIETKNKTFNPPLNFLYQVYLFVKTGPNFLTYSTFLKNQYAVILSLIYTLQIGSL